MSLEELFDKAIECCTQRPEPGNPKNKNWVDCQNCPLDGEIDCTRILRRELERREKGKAPQEEAQITPEERIESLEIELENYRRNLGDTRRELQAAEEKLETLQRLLNGEWVDTQDVEAALGITFREGLKRFEFSREASWNPWPLNGQRITTKFRLREEKKDEP